MNFGNFPLPKSVRETYRIISVFFSLHNFTTMCIFFEEGLVNSFFCPVYVNFKRRGDCVQFISFAIWNTCLSILNTSPLALVAFLVKEQKTDSIFDFIFDPCCSHIIAQSTFISQISDGIQINSQNS